MELMCFLRLWAMNSYNLITAYLNKTLFIFCAATTHWRDKSFYIVRCVSQQVVQTIQT